MDEDAKFGGDAINLVEENLAFTGIVNKKPIFAAGMKMIWGQVAEGWVIATHEVWNHPLAVAKAIKKILLLLLKKIILKEYKLL